MVNKGLW